MWARTSGPANINKINVHSKHSSWHICGPTMGDPANSNKINVCYKHASQHICGSATSNPANSDEIYPCSKCAANIYVHLLWVVQPTAIKYMGIQIPHFKHASQQPSNIMCYMHAGQHICAPTASVPADWCVIYVCYTHATIRTDMAWDSSDICLLQACHPAISHSPIGLVSTLLLFLAVSAQPIPAMVWSLSLLAFLHYAWGQCQH